MTVFTHILFPIDFSQRSRGTAPFVKEMAQHYGARVTLLHITEIGPQVYGSQEYGSIDLFVPLPDFSEPLLQSSRRQMRSFASEHFGDPGTDFKLEEVCQVGEAAHSITEYADSTGVDLIMMPTHGYGRFRALLLGSIAAKVLHDAKCPVWTGVHLEEAIATKHLKIRTVLCAVDLKKESVHVAKFALAVASAHGARMRLVHTVPSAETRPEQYFDEKMQNALIEAARSELVEIQRECGAEEGTISVEAGSVSSKVRSAALQLGADLVVIGRGQMHAPFGRLRTNAYAIIRDAPCPVLSV